MSERPDAVAAESPRSGLRTSVAAATYTLVAALQKAGGFLLLIAFTRVLAPSEYGVIALLTTVSGLLLMTMTLGLEPRIMYSYFRVQDGLAAYLRTAERVSIIVPVGMAALLCLVVFALPLDDPTMWAMECAGACLLAAGTTYPYAVLRAARRAFPYAALALGLLTSQIAGRLVFVVAFDWGPRGWAASDLVTGLLAIVAGPMMVRRSRPAREAGRRSRPWAVIREGLPLVPHYLAQWGLSLSDRLILVLFVSTAAIGIYSAIYQIAAVISLILSEVNRAFMPSYAQKEPGDPGLPALVGVHLRVTLVLYGLMFLGGFAAMHVVLPDAYASGRELFPLLAVGALVYGLYFIPMNGLTLVAGVTNRAPLISVTALAGNVAVNLSLGGSLGVWGAVWATVTGYVLLATLAFLMARRAGSFAGPQGVWRPLPVAGAYLVLAAASLTTAWLGVLQPVGLTVVAAITVLIGLLTARGGGVKPLGPRATSP